MIQPQLIVALGLVLLVAAFSVAARRLRIATPILMLVGGILLAFIPNLPQVHVDPDLVLLVLLPPLLYSAGVGMSWRGFRSSLRPILLLAVGCVLATAGVVATAMHYLLGVSWSVGFVLGAIVSPPDAVAPMAILRRLPLPRRLHTILEGESLVNDATALVTLSFALAAVGSATFSFSAAALQFLIIVGAELTYGILIGYAVLRLRHAVNDARAEVLIALATPFLAFWPPHALGGSGVIACVVTGLYVSWNGRKMIRPATRLQGFFIWDLIVWAVEALLFLLAGLQARSVVGSIASEAWPRILAAAALTCVMVIVVRFVWIFFGTYLHGLLPRTTRLAQRQAEPPPDWRQLFLIAYTGLRGAVSLAAALLIPAVVNGQPFPDRELILFATYSVIVVTLVGLGGTLPAIVRALGIDRQGATEAIRDKHDEQSARLIALDKALEAIPEDHPSGRSHTLRDRLRARHEYFERGALRAGPVAPSSEDTIDLELLEVERQAVDISYAENRLTDEARRRIERELDLEEARLRHAMESSGLRGDDA
ncbi:MAG: Na+/H+ antiporter [Pseudomonadota bacterium]